MSFFFGKTLSKIVGNQNKNESPDVSNVAIPSSNASNSSRISNTPILSLFQRNHPVTFSNQFQQDAHLTLTHLRKIFYEYLHPRNKQELTQNEKDEKLYSILPLFIKVLSVILKVGNDLKVGPF